MTIKKKNGQWHLDLQKKGLKRQREVFETKSAAELWEREFLAKNKLKLEQIKDNRTIRELVESWYIYHGINLSDGERRKSKLLYMCAELKNPIASTFTAENFVQYRFKKTVTNEKTVTQKTFNNAHGYLNAVYSKLRKLKVIDYESPIADVEFIKIQERQLSYLSRTQIDILLESIQSGCINKSTWYVAQICLRTGARWSEAEQLCKKQLHSGRITFEFTKSKRTRTVPLDPVFYGLLMELCKLKNPDDRLFDNCISSFRRAVYRTDLQLPKGQMTHILRHSFASHFMINDGNILVLQKILGHADITMTMRYAHLSPDHLSDAVKLNPLS